MRLSSRHPSLDSRQLKIRDWRPSARWPQRTEPAPMPSLHQQGHWIERAGFAIGANVRVQVTSRRLVVEVVEHDRDMVVPRASL
jgi:hypothetical protein